MKNISFYISRLGKYRKTFVWSGVVLLTLLLILFFSAPWIAKYFFYKEIRKVEQHNHIRIAVDGFKLDGLSGFDIESLHVIPFKNDTLFSFRKLEVDFNLWQILLLNPDVTAMKASSIQANFIKKGDYCNYNFLFTSQEDQNKNAEHRTDYSGRISTLLNTFFRLIPSRLAIESLDITSDNNNYDSRIVSHNLRVLDNRYSFPIQIQDSISRQQWLVDGVFDKGDRNISGKISSRLGGKAILPYLDHVYHARIAFDNLSFDLHPQKEGHGVIALTGHASFKGLEVNHARLSSDDILLGDGAINYSMHVGPDYAELDSVSEINYNKISFHPYFFVQKNTDWKIKALINKDRFAASDLLSSLPKGLFHNLSGIHVKGDLSYHFLFDVDLEHPQGLKLESSLKKRNFSILNSGELSRMNSPFLYTAYEKDQPVRTFEVGPGNSQFSRLEEISPLLRQAVLQSEDGQFFFHKGFRLDALREALVYDLKVKRFARGGSTISMQLVKNVFLTRHKNIARKLEEALLVWMIEENRITSKSRMFEVYLNIAEWGPMIYGIGEASRFYFDKMPADLTLNEAIFLAGIIPSPKKFTRAFDSTGLLKGNRQWYFRRIADRLYRTGYISQLEKDSFIPNVELLGPAKRYAIPLKKDTLKSIALDFDQVVNLITTEK